MMIVVCPALLRASGVEGNVSAKCRAHALYADVNVKDGAG